MAKRGVAVRRTAAADPSVSELAARLAGVEGQRDQLLTELAARTQDALDPRSEVGNLLAQLSDGDEAESKRASYAASGVEQHRCS